MCVYILIVLLCFILTLRLTLSTAIASLGLIIASVIDYYIFAFRGSEIQPADILSIQTAGNVAANYHVVISNTILYGVLLTGVYILIGFGLPKLEVQSKINSRIALTIMFSVVSILFFVESQSIVAAHFLREGMVTNGFILNFSLQLRETFVKKPEGYSSDKVQEIAEKYKESEEDTTISTREEPDIIVIMDESFADLSVLGSELKTNQQVTHETDIAVEKLIEYFKSVENNVVLVFYGDHFPNLNDEFYNEIHGGSFTSLDEQQLKYEIPFFIWTNYDIKEEKVKLTSLNFLSNYVYKVAGVQLPKYNKVLADINEEIPAMNANGYYSIIENKFLSYNQAKGKEADILNMYYQLEYNNIFDNKNRNNILFPKIKKNK